MVLPASGALGVFLQVELCGRFLLPYLPASHEAGYERTRLRVFPPLTRRATKGSVFSSSRLSRGGLPYSNRGYGTGRSGEDLADDAGLLDEFLARDEQ